MWKWYQVRRASREILPSPQIVTPNLIKDYIRHGNINDARKLFDQNPTSCDTVAWNSMITAHIRHNQMQCAHELFDRMPLKDVVSWNAMMFGFNVSKDPHRLHQLFLQMNRAGSKPNEFTFSTVISGFLNMFDVLVPHLHGLILHLGLHSNVFVGSALMRGYTHLGDREGLCRVFDDILVKDASTWNALVVGYMDLGLTGEAQMTFDMMPEVNIISWTALVDGYIKNRKINQARSIFDGMTEKNVVSWTAMIKGYVQHHRYMDAIQLLMLMLKSGTRPNHFTFSTLLDACAGCSSLVLGRQLHSSVFKSGVPLQVEAVLMTSLIDMYTKCGDIGAALCLFESMENKYKNLVSWNSIIGGCGRHGLARRALCEFEKMIKSGVKPDHITYINLLSACVHGGLVEEGERYFNSMGIQAEMRHYTCMVDLYGRAGELEKAEKLVKEMPFEPDVGVWGALLAACGLYSCHELGEFAAHGLENLVRNHPMLIKLHGEKGAWGRVIQMRKTITRNQKAGSRIEFPLGVGVEDS